MGDITPTQIVSNSFLSSLIAQDPAYYLSYFAGEPCLIRGVEGYGDDSKIVISPCLKFFSRLGNARVSQNRIKFCYGGEQRLENRQECYEFGVRRIKIGIITEEQRLPPVSFPLVLTREHNDDCPVCLDKLTGACVECSNKHQICLPCYNLTPLRGGAKACPVCRSGTYSPAELEKVAKMGGEIITSYAYFSSSVDGGNSFKMFRNSEALFLGIIRYAVNHIISTPLERMVLSSFHNFYINHPDAFSTWDFNLMTQYNGNNRRIKSVDEMGGAFDAYLAVIESPAIYEDVKYSDITPYSYSDSQYYNDLEYITGSLNLLKDYTEGRAVLLKREILFRAGIKRIPENDRPKFIFGILEKMLRGYKNYRVMISLENIQI
jgi:hypothetical protein